MILMMVSGCGIAKDAQHTPVGVGTSRDEYPRSKCDRGYLSSEAPHLNFHLAAHRDPCEKGNMEHQRRLQKMFEAEERGRDI